MVSIQGHKRDEYVLNINIYNMTYNIYTRCYAHGFRMKGENKEAIKPP